MLDPKNSRSPARVLGAWLALVVTAGLFALPVLASGCSSSAPKDEGTKPAPVEKASPKPEARPNDTEQLEPITIKKGDKKTPEAAYLDKPDAGNVSFAFSNADLGKIALPLYSKQAGVVVEYSGPVKTLTLRLVNVPWRDALLEICRFTQTHAVQSQVHGRIELKLGSSDSKPFLDRYDPNRRDVELSGGADTAALDGSGSTTVTTTGAPGTTTAGNTAGGSSSGSTTSPEPGSGEIADPNAKGNATIERLRTGVSTTNSGQ